MRLVQFLDRDQSRRVAMVSDDGTALRVLRQTQRVYELALEAGRRKLALSALVQDRLGTDSVSYDEIVSERRLLPPLDHADSARCLITGTGLSHLGSAAARDSMHVKLKQDESQLTDSMKMFKWGLEGGKPAAGTIGVPPEWFYKGDGRCVVPPEHDARAAQLRARWRRGSRSRRLLRDRRRRRAVARRLCARQRVRRSRDGAAELSVPRALQAAPVLVRAGAVAGRAAGERHRRGAPAARRQGDLERELAVRRGQHGAFGRQPRASSLQVPRLPPARRRARAFLRRGHRQLHQERQDGDRRRVRDHRARVRPAAAQSARRGAGGEAFVAVRAL